MPKKIKILNDVESQAIYVIGERVFGDKLKNDPTKSNSLAGQPYWLCEYQGTAFTCKDAGFVKRLDTGEVAETTIVIDYDEPDTEGEDITINAIEWRSYRNADALESIQERQVRTARRNRTLKLLREAPATPQELQSFVFADAPTE